MNGFLPCSRGSLILDFIALVMAIIIPLMLYSIFAVRYRKQYKVHRRLQISLGLGLGLALTGFELDMRINGWRQFAEASPYYQSLVFPALWLHLAIAVPTLFLWIYTIFMALRQHSTYGTSGFKFRHKVFGRLSAYAMLGTAVSGWLFFWLAFLA